MACPFEFILTQEKILTLKIIIAVIFNLSRLFCCGGMNKFAKLSKFLSPPQADGVLRNFAPSGRVLLKHGTRVASYGVFIKE
jgi:hypothetical protein